MNMCIIHLELFGYIYSACGPVHCAGECRANAANTVPVTTVPVQQMLCACRRSATVAQKHARIVILSAQVALVRVLSSFLAPSSERRRSPAEEIRHPEE